MSIATQSGDLEITGDYEATSLGLLNAGGYAVVISAVSQTPSAKTFDTGLQQIETITFQNFAGTAQNDYVVVTTFDNIEYAVAMDKVVAQELQTFTFPTQSSLNSGEYIILETIAGDQYAVAMDKSLAAEVAQISPASVAGTTSGDYVVFYSQDGSETYGISLDKTLAAEVSEVTFQSADDLGNDDWFSVTTASDNLTYAIAFDKSLQPEITTATFQSPGGTGNNDYFAIYAKNGAGELSVAVNLDKSLMPQIDQLTFETKASTGNDDWIFITAQDGTDYGVALDKSKEKQQFDIQFVSPGSTADGDYCVFTDLSSNTWAFSLDKLGQYGKDQIECKPIGACTGGDYFVLEAIDGTQYAVAINVTGIDPDPTGGPWTSINVARKTNVNISGLFTGDDIATALIAAFNAMTGFSADFSLATSSTVYIIADQLATGVEVAASSYNSVGTPGATSFTLTQLNIGVASTVPAGASWSAVDPSRKVIATITTAGSADDIATIVNTALGTVSGFSGEWVYSPDGDIIHFTNADYGLCFAPQGYDSAGTAAASFTVNIITNGADIGEPSGPIWAGLSGSNKTVVDMTTLTTAAQIAAQARTQLIALTGLTSKLTITDPFTDGTLVVTQVTSGVVSAPVSYNSAEDGSGAATVVTTQTGGNETTPAGALWAATYSAKITVNLYGLSTAGDVANAVNTQMNLIPNFSDYVSSSVGSGTITFTNVESGPVASVPFSKNTNDSTSGSIVVSIVQEGANSSQPSGPLWNAIPGTRKSVIYTNSSENAVDIAAVATSALNALSGFSAKVTVTDNLDGTITLTQVTAGAVADPVPHNNAENAPGEIAISVTTAGADAVIPTGVLWQSLPAENKATVEIRTLTTAIQVAAAMASAGATLMAANITVSYSAGDNYFTTTQLTAGAVDNPVPKNENDSGAGSISVSITTPGADIQTPTTSDWADVVFKVVVDGRSLSTAAQVCTAYFNAFSGFIDIEDQLILTNLGGGQMTVKYVALGDSPNPVISNYNGSGSPTISYVVTTPGGVPSEPTGAAWLAIPAANKGSAACAGLTTAAEVATAAFDALKALEGFGDNFSIVNTGGGVLTLTLVVDGPATAPTPHNTGDTGDGSIAGAITTPGVASDVLLSESLFTVPSHEYSTGLAVQLSGAGDTLPAPLVEGDTYYVISIDKNHLKFAATHADALAETNIVLEDTGTPEATFTITPEAFSLTLKMQGSNDGFTFADVTGITKTLTNNSAESVLWNVGPVYYEYIRLASTGTGGQSFVNYFINAR
jgi:hypothetical protein